MLRNKALYYLGLSLVTLALLSLIVWLIKSYTLPILPGNINQTILLLIAIILGVSGLLASFNDISDLLHKILGNETGQKEIEFLEVSVEKAAVKYIQTGNYWVQINLRFYAGEKDIYLKAIRLRTSQGLGWTNENTQFGKNGLPVTFLMPYQEQDFLSLSHEEFYDRIKGLEFNSIKVRDLLIHKDSYLSVALIGDLHSERLPDGWEDFPLNNWHFFIDYGDDKQVDCQFSFSIHPSSPTRAVKFEHYGFEF
jgi:hypothetical protein